MVQVQNIKISIIIPCLNESRFLEKTIKNSLKLKGKFDGQMDKYYDMWIERCEYMNTQKLPKNWNGVFIATTK